MADFTSRVVFTLEDVTLVPSVSQAPTPLPLLTLLPFPLYFPNVPAEINVSAVRNIYAVCFPCV